MDAFVAMIWRALPPVRRRVPLARMSPEAGRDLARRFFKGHEIVLFESGTQALSAAIRQCKSCSNLANPEAILPAYGCPDLVSACLYAGVRPRLVDTAPGAWGYDLQALRQACSPNTVAIVAVNLFGLGDDAVRLREIARGVGAALIQDSAQHLPRDGGAWCGDGVVLSFGRGKPLNLLCDGALILTGGMPFNVAAVSQDRGRTLLSSRFASVLFNVLTHPAVYGWVSRLPGMGIGATRYKSLNRVANLPFGAWGRFGAAIEGYGREPSYSTKPWKEALESWRRWGITPLVATMGLPPGEDLLRLPLLAPNREVRDRLVEACNRQGLGASSMYGVPLPSLPGIPAEVASQGPFTHAKDLADRLFTLPTHSCVKPRDVEAANVIVREMHS